MVYSYYMQPTAEMQFSDFNLMIVAYLRTLNMNETADRLLANKNEAVNFLLQNNWTTADLTDQKWKKDRLSYHVYGKLTDNNLKNTNGIKIGYGFGVVISYFDADGMSTTPRIYCNADGFDILWVI